MIVIWGKKVRRRQEGAAADFCPVCRDITECSVRSVHHVDHVYFISLRGGEHVADELTCSECGLVRGLSTGQVRPLPSSGGEIHDVAVRTGPMTEDELAQRLELEARAAEGALTPEERIRLIAESIHAMEYEYLANQDKGLRASISAVLQLMMIVGIFASVIMWYMWMNPVSSGTTPPFPLWQLIVSGVTALLLSVVTYRMAADQRAGARGNLDLLARSLAPLKPQEHELEDALFALRKAKVNVARQLSLREVIAALQRA